MRAVLASDGEGLIVCELPALDVSWTLLGDVVDDEDDPLIGLFDPFASPFTRYLGYYRLVRLSKIKEELED